jgi:hypothetical protein
MKPKFKVGDIVIARNSKECKHNPRVEGKEYKVVGVTFCRECHDELLCINENGGSKSYRMKCGKCGNSDMLSSHFWTSASNFMSKDFDPYYELNLAIKMEDYERAAELRDQINAERQSS